MESRVHRRNNLKLSVLNINLIKFFSNDLVNKKIYLENLLSDASSKKINFIQIPLAYTDILEIILDWEIKNHYIFNKSFLFGFPRNDLDKLNYSFTRDELYDNRFKNIENELKKLINDYQMTKIEFLTLIYPKITHFEKFNLQEIIKRIKDTNFVNSIGIHCHKLADALLFCKVSEIDHIEIELNINSSLELENSIFKVTEAKNIAVFCHLNDIVENLDEVKHPEINSLAELLNKGNEIINERITSAFFIKEKDLVTLTLRKYLASDFQSFTLAFLDKDKIDLLWICLNKPYLTNDDQNILKGALESNIYNSPKKFN